MASLYMVYSFTRGSLEEKTTVAFENARHIIDIEKALHIFVELDIQSVFLQNDFMMHTANVLYTICYYPAVIGFAVWAYWRHRRKYKFMRTVFAIGISIAVIIFALFPLAPPRFFDGRGMGEDLGFIDTIAQHWHVNEATDQASYNPFAAMPSMHQGLTLMVAIGIFWMTESRAGRIFAVILPLGMFVGITSTANHFILDAVGGATVILSSFWLTRHLYRYLNKRKSKRVLPLKSGTQT